MSKRPRPLICPRRQSRPSSLGRRPDHEDVDAVDPTDLEDAAVDDPVATLELDVESVDADLADPDELPAASQSASNDDAVRSSSRVSAVSSSEELPTTGRESTSTAGFGAFVLTDGWRHVSRQHTPSTGLTGSCGGRPHSDTRPVSLETG
jgi:hypothetical protein